MRVGAARGRSALVRAARGFGLAARAADGPVPPAVVLAARAAVVFAAPAVVAFALRGLAAARRGFAFAPF